MKSIHINNVLFEPSQDRMEKEDLILTQQNNAASQNTTVLAYLGDAVYELYVRQHVLLTGTCKVEELHRSAVRYVRAEAQALSLKGILPDLTEQELALVKRARNRKITSKPKNAEPVSYKWATAFEALVGFLYLFQETERMEQIIAMAIVMIDSLPSDHS